MPSCTNIRILYHDHCFDGAASAAFVTRFFQDCVYPGAQISYTGLVHLPETTWPDTLFDGDENAIVDFKYSPHPKLSWWFDHHESAFLSAADEAHFRNDQSGRKYLDVNSKSCAKLIQNIAANEFGYSARDLEELIDWANIVDGALYANAGSAVALEASAMKLTLVIDNAPSSVTVQEIIRLMQRHRLDEIVRHPRIEPLCSRFYERHLKSIDMIRHHCRVEGCVVFFDLSGTDIDSYNKFIPYFLFPGACYAVSITSTPTRIKISVGSNPWPQRPLVHNLADLCERYGGGGHRAVGAISIEAGALMRARAIVSEITNELNSIPGQELPSAG